MNETITINVIQEDINEYQRDNKLEPLICPIAKALKRETGYTWEVNYCTAFPCDNKEIVYLLPPLATKFIVNVDNYEPVTPSTFTLTLQSKRNV